MSKPIIAVDVDIESLLLGDYSWNRQEEPLQNNVVRKTSWQQVVEYIHEPRSRV